MFRDKETELWVLYMRFCGFRFYFLYDGFKCVFGGVSPLYLYIFYKGPVLDKVTWQVIVGPNTVNESLLINV